jgi:CRP-like cAMP-binding protein
MHADDALLIELRGHYLFSALTDAQLGRVLATATTRRFSAGEHLFSHHDPATRFFLLRSGGVKLFRTSPEGGEKIMRLIRPGETFAESVLFMDAPQYPVHGAGIESGELIAFDRDAFLEILRNSFAACRAVMAQMSRRIQSHWDEIETLALQNSRYRIVHYLSTLIPANARGPVTVMLPARKMLIAAQLAVTPETLSRTLRILSDERLIVVAGDAVTIPDVPRFLARGDGHIAPHGGHSPTE